jgi:hypothetical protein
MFHNNGQIYEAAKSKGKAAKKEVEELYEVFKNLIAIWK